MLRLSNISIGIKLAVISGLGILLAVSMMVVQLYGDSTVKRANADVFREQAVARGAYEAKAAIRDAQIAVRDIRLAGWSEEAQAAVDSLADTQKILVETGNKMLGIIKAADERDRVEKIKTLFEQYVVAAKAIAAAKQQVFVLGMSEGADAAVRIGEYSQQMDTLAKEKALPLAKQMEDLADQILDSAKATVAKRIAATESAQATSEQLEGLFGVVVLAVLLGAAVFGFLAIGRPMRRMARVLNELTNDRVVEVPYTNRGDEIGDIAKATELFKQSIAQKVINLRVRSALDAVRASMMIADDQYNIIYTNNNLNSMMKEVEADLRKVLPDLDVSNLVGVNMDVFHSDPARQRKILDELTGSYDDRITIGTQKFHLVATAVMDAHGKRAGTVVEWRNVTAREEIEAEVDGIVKAAVAGDFSRRLPLEGKKDFMLNLASAMNALCENTESALANISGMMASLAEGDLSRRITADYEGMFGKLKADANAMADRLAATIGEIKFAAREVTSASAEISASTTDLSQRTEEQAASLEETSASMEEIASTIKRNAENAQAANRSAGDTREVADRGGEVVAKAVQAMARIEDSSRKISDIIGVIDEIARQTNLLALNAAVEAARAGDAGRGFAVVASEVRSLAQRSSQAAKDINDLINRSNEQVKEGVQLVDEAGKALNEIVESIKGVAQVVSEIATASAEQATGLDQITKALAQMDEVTQQNSALVEENAATAKTLEDQARSMDERISFFRFGEAKAGAGAVRQSTPVRAAPRRAVA